MFTAVVWIGQYGSWSKGGFASYDDPRGRGTAPYFAAPNLELLSLRHVIDRRVTLGGSPLHPKIGARGVARRNPMHYNSLQ